MINVAIIGAGMAGLTVGNLLKDYANVTLFEKSRGLGGRMATRRAEPYYFDHGAQFLMAKTNEFASFIQPMIDANVIKPWFGRFVEFEQRKIIRQRQWCDDPAHYVGVPGMSAIGQYLAQGLDVRISVCVHSLQRSQSKWLLMDDQGQVLGEYDWVIAAVPAKQAMAVLPCSVAFYEKLRTVKMTSCFSLMLGFQEALPLEFDAALVRGADISWMAVNHTKPNRANEFSLLIQSTNKWADEHIDADRGVVMSHLCHEASNIVGQDLSTANHQAIHAWRFANIAKQVGNTHDIDAKQSIAICGDWFIQGRIEAAFISAREMVDHLKSITSVRAIK